MSSTGSINPNTPPGNNPNQTSRKDSRDLPLKSKVFAWLALKSKVFAWLALKSKVLAWLATTLIALAGLAISIKGCSAQDETAALAAEQTQQIYELQKTTPTGNITGMVPNRPSKQQSPIAVEKILYCSRRYTICPVRQ